MALQITYQFTQLVKHSLKPQHFAPAKLRHTKQCLPTSSTPSISIFNSGGLLLAQLPRIFLSFPNTMGHRPQGEKLPPIHCTMDTKGKGSRLLISPGKQMSFQSQTGNEWDLHQTTAMGKISSPILSFVS